MHPNHAAPRTKYQAPRTKPPRAPRPSHRHHHRQASSSRPDPTTHYRIDPSRRRHHHHRRRRRRPPPPGASSFSSPKHRTRKPPNMHINPQHPLLNRRLKLWLHIAELILVHGVVILTMVKVFMGMSLRGTGRIGLAFVSPSPLIGTYDILPSSDRYTNSIVNNNRVPSLSSSSSTSS